MGLLFSFTGRIEHATFWIGYLAILLQDALIVIVVPA